MSMSLRGLGSAAAWLLVASALPAVAAEAPTTIVTQGTGTLTMCRNWFFFNSCQSYNRVTLPLRLQIGDSIDLVFGSNTKHINFPVVRISQIGDRCTIYNEADTGNEEVDKIEVGPCRPAAP